MALSWALPRAGQRVRTHVAAILLLSLLHAPGVFGFLQLGGHGCFPNEFQVAPCDPAANPPLCCDANSADCVLASTPPFTSSSQIAGSNGVCTRAPANEVTLQLGEHGCFPNAEQRGVCDTTPTGVNQLCCNAITADCDHGTPRSASNPVCASATGTDDPHYELTGVELEEGQRFVFDFHGEANKTFCMFSDTSLQINVQMIGLPSGTKVLQPRFEEVELFFDTTRNGTWMSGFGFLYFNRSGEQQSVTVELNPALDREGKYPFELTFQAEPIPDVKSAPWTSPDGLAAIRLVNGTVNKLLVTISDTLAIEIVTEVEKELITDPAVHYLNFELQNFATSATIHGFLGQMFAPGAIPERLAMGTLEGLRHREYVEGRDEDYVTSSLVSANCAFNRFAQTSEEYLEEAAGVNVEGRPSSEPIDEQHLLGHSLTEFHYLRGTLQD
ncbi:hypothetical protein KFL_003750050 [Klebsormidium nitens]|uniref:Root cap family protein n=1 Tax=Klebsormidium nitens TaxID=105231 RepID=A0A1Y1I9W0_KLENI|nr:hypothetical protein KFL_003750050 [Klebsormidium nitens]|eukprot:GAQ87755.1 hypothetical protein KFL_003750050 [Klebsormidium nitens]